VDASSWALPDQPIEVVDQHHLHFDRRPVQSHAHLMLATLQRVQLKPGCKREFDGTIAM
jgi:hypothetical protein